MKRTGVAVLVSLVAGLLVPGVRLAPQRGIDFLPGDEEVQAVVKPIAPDASDVPDQQRQQPEPEHVVDEGLQLREREQPEAPATVDPVENEPRTEDPAEAVTALTAEDEPVDDPIEDQFAEEHGEDAFDPVTDQPEDAVQNSTSTNESPSPAATDDPTGPSQKDSTAADEDEPSAAPASKPAQDGSSTEQRLTTEPIVVEEPGTTEPNDDSNQLAEDVNSLADDSTNQARFGLEESRNQEQPEPPAQPNRAPKTPNVHRVPQVQSQTTEPPVPVRPHSASDEYDSKSFESNEDDDQVQLKVGPNDQFRPLAPWFSSTRVTGYDQWQQQQQQQQQQGSSIPVRSSWQPRHYQPSSFDGFHGHGFHRSSWH